MLQAGIAAFSWGIGALRQLFWQLQLSFAHTVLGSALRSQNDHAFAMDSPLEGDRFELSVPGRKSTSFRRCPAGSPSTAAGSPRASR